MNLKKPLYAYAGLIFDTDGYEVGSGVPHRHSEQIVREVNAFDALLAACEAALPVCEHAATTFVNAAVAAEKIRAAIAASQDTVK